MIMAPEMFLFSLPHKLSPKSVKNFMGCLIPSPLIQFRLSLGTGLEKVWEAKPLVNGKEIMSELQLKLGGPIVKEWV